MNDYSNENINKKPLNLDKKLSKKPTSYKLDLKTIRY